MDMSQEHINRRNFIKKTSTGLMTCSVLPGMWTVQNKTAEKKLNEKEITFREYQKGQTLGKVLIVSGNDAPYMHTFFDVQPFSPSQRYIALTRLPYQYKNPVYGDKADICILDLESRMMRVIYSTKVWGHQLGSNVQWGINDQYVYANDWIGEVPVCVRIDIHSGETLAYDGPLYHISPNAEFIAGFPPNLINYSQMGYGGPDNQSNKSKPYTGAPNNIGLIKTKLASNQKEMLFPLSAFQKYYNDAKFKDGTFYLFHTKINSSSDKIFQVVRCMVPNSNSWNPSLFTFDSNGSNLIQVIKPSQWAQGGNHPNWHPDGKRIIMNLRAKEELNVDKISFVSFNSDGKEMKLLSKRSGSGHPSVTADDKYLVSDAYSKEKEFINDLGEAKIRLIDLNKDDEEAICHVYVPPVHVYGSLRIDPHPVWNRDFKKVLFCGAPEGKREVFIADLSEVL